MHDLKMTDKLLANCEHSYGVWKMQDWKKTDKHLANCEHNYGVWKMQEYKSSWVQPTHTVYIKEAVHDTPQSSTGMSSHLQRSVFRTSGATAAMEGSTECRAIPKGRGFVYAYDSQLYRQVKKVGRVRYLKCTIEHCDGSAKLDKGQITTRVSAVSKMQSMLCLWLGRKLWAGGEELL